ncbi:fumarate hydratase [Rhodoplanes roseus]|uniref:Fumarate hydratase n=1 Tax=Rhodoplanes roseus TaxID=29409 RepID=A0A327L3E8_9BRAD|nr:fumarate hydratase [Rhodoplanes roseus]RAI44575.1 fumarate hydratase [Rhodoplanes roseus]
MAITYDAVRTATADLYAWSLRTVPDDAVAALRASLDTETVESARKVLRFMLTASERARTDDKYLCTDAGVPSYDVRIGTAARIDGDIKQAIVDGFAQLCATAEPPILKFVTNPLTNQRSFAGKDMPLVTWDVVSGADYVEMICSPKALGTGRWASIETFVSPSLETIERHVMDCVLKAGSQPCPPVVVGIGIGGTFDIAAKLASKATLRPFGTPNPEPILAEMERRLLVAINSTGFGPMGTGGDTTALGVHIDYASGHGYTPVAVCFNCWINRRTRARLYNSGVIERCE